MMSTWTGPETLTVHPLAPAMGIAMQQVGGVRAAHGTASDVGGVRAAHGTISAVGGVTAAH